MALKGQAPVVPVAITGTRDAMRKGSYVIQPVTVTVRFGAPVETAGMSMEQRDELARIVRERVEQLLEEG
jgi:1-acyl-sn-glycerol-3-phosphate acyltransferase